MGESGRRAPSPPLAVLLVNPLVHGAEIERFVTKLVTAPARPDGTPSRMCSLWSGAVANDGYGRFHVQRDGFSYTVRAHRYAVALRLGIPVPFGQVAAHAECDNPICVLADPDPDIGHIWPSTQKENLAEMGRKGRGGGSGWWRRKWSGLNRVERAERSRQLRNVVKTYGWDEPRIREVLMRIDPAQLGLF